MKALVFSGLEKVSYETIADPRIEQAGDAIIQVDRCAICGSDLHVYHGREKGCDHGTAMGHEFVGAVEEAGPSVKNFRKGDRIMSPFTTSCGECYFCRMGLTARCTKGQLFGWRKDSAGLHGGQAEYVRVPMADSTLMTIPEGISEELALLMGDILSTAFFCADTAGAGPRKTHIIVGCGPVGLLTILAAKARGAEQVFAIDSVPARLKVALEWGATAVDIRSTDAVATIRDATEGRGADCVMEAVGSDAALRTGFDLLRTGGTLSSVGVNTHPVYPFTPEEVYNKNATVRSGRCSARHYMNELLQKAGDFPVDITRIFSHRMKLSEGEEAYRKFAAREDNCLKVIMIP